MARRSLPEPAAPGIPPIGGVPRRSAALNLLRSLRPEQWTKNLVIFAGLIFGHRLTDRVAVQVVVAAFVIFCALSGVVYLVNDIVDRESDRRHPVKARRPIASGALPVG
ncbi:MAG: UbiA family prenyltransferase, partial [Acidobacteriota bacterium]|nr:UbiA family prenyltransferase [Acidobacteriota bacterium]